MNLPQMFLLKRLFGVAQNHATKLNYCTRPQQNFNPKEIEKSAKLYFSEDDRWKSAELVWRGLNFTVMKYFLEMNYLIGSKKAMDKLCSLAIRCRDISHDLDDLRSDWHDGMHFWQSPYGDFTLHYTDCECLMEDGLRFLERFPLLDQKKVKERVAEEFGQVLDMKNVNRNRRLTVQKIEGYPHTTVAFCGKFYYPSHKFL